MEDELEILKSIYNHEIKINKTNRQIEYSIDIAPPSGETENPIAVCLQLSITIHTYEYPEKSPEIKIKNARGISEKHVKSIYEHLENLCREKLGEYIVYDIIEATRDNLNDRNVPAGSCAICMEDFTDISTIMRTSCYHFLHTSCLNTYFEYFVKNSEEFNDSKIDRTSLDEMPCPICRNLTAVTKDTIVDCDGNGNSTAPRRNQSRNTSISTLAPHPASTSTFIPNARQRKEQRIRAQLYKKQLRKGGIIDVETERLRFLVVTNNPLPSSPVVEQPKNETKQNIEVKKDNTESKVLPVAAKQRNNHRGRYSRLKK